MARRLAPRSRDPLSEPAPRSADSAVHWRAWGAEAAGTALFVLVALSAVALVSDTLPSTSARMLVIGAFVATIVSAIAVSPLGRLSGAHLNPAITLAFRALGMVSARDVVGYVVGQFVGALVGAALFRALWGSLARSVGGGVTHPTVSTSGALGLEAGMTALLMATILLFVSRERLAREGRAVHPARG